MRTTGRLAVAVVFCFLSSKGFALEPLLLQGTVVKAEDYPAVLQLLMDGDSHCSATLVGTRVLVTAAHCVPDKKQQMSFKIGKDEYNVELTAHPDMVSDFSEYDIALGLIEKDVVDAKPIAIGGKAGVGTPLNLMGYGCMSAKKNPYDWDLKWDDKLRRGRVQISQIVKTDMMTRSPIGIGGCFGDSGGPAFTFEKGEEKILGVISKADIRRLTLSVRLDLPKSQEFIKDFADKHGVEIRGINDVAEAEIPEDPATAEVPQSN